MTNAKRLALLVRLPSGAALAHGWHLAGAGPARYGWAIRSAAGALEWLGSTAAMAIAKIERDKSDHAARFGGEMTERFHPRSWVAAR